MRVCVCVSLCRVPSYIYLFLRLSTWKIEDIRMTFCSDPHIHNYSYHFCMMGVDGEWRSWNQSFFLALVCQFKSPSIYRCMYIIYGKIAIPTTLFWYGPLLCWSFGLIPISFWPQINTKLFCYFI